MDWLGWGSSSEDSAAKPAPSDSRAAASSSEAGGESVLDSVFGAFGWGTSAANATVSEAAKPPTATAATAAAAAPARSGMGLRETPTDLEAVDETEVSVGGQRRSDGDSWLGGLSKAWDTVVHTIAADDAPTRHISHSVHFTEAEQREVTTEHRAMPRSPAPTVRLACWHVGRRSTRKSRRTQRRSAGRR